MRPEISNELLLQVIQAWDPSKAGDWLIRPHGSLVCGDFGIRHGDGEMFAADEGDPWGKHCELVKFLLQDRPALNSHNGFEWDPKVTLHCRREFVECWASDPWRTDFDTPSPSSIVGRIKSYDYLREWKESQGCNPGCKCGDIKHMTDEDIVRHFGEELTGISGADLEIFDDHLPATYEQLCPHCNGSKEVTGWLGKESCQACG